MSFSRYAVYYLPEEEQPWTEFCTAWLGWDLNTGRRVEHPNIDRLGRPVSALTTAPRRYGLHATLKPPFRLAPGKTRSALETSLREFAENQPHVILDGLQITPLGRFLALTAKEDSSSLNALASNIVRELDAYRARATPQELEKRRAARLSEQQDDNLIRWGYPYVMESFRFHITLTGKLPKDELTIIKKALAEILEPMLPSPFQIADVALVGEDEDGFFRLIQRYPLTGQV